MRVKPDSGAVATVAALVLLGLLAGCAEPAPPPPLIGQLDVETRLRQGEPPLLLDVRTPQEYAAGHVPGAINIPHTELGSRAEELSAYRQVELVLYCEDGRRTALAATTLHGRGFERLLHLEGDFSVWRAKGRPVAAAGG